MKSEKATLIAELSNRFDRCFNTPENPFTLDNPDLLVAKGRDIFAIYIPTFNETLRPDYLLRRVYVSHLCYGVKLNPILFSSRERSSTTPNVYNHSFRHISTDLDDIVKYINLEHPQYERHKHFSVIQARQYERFRFNLELSEQFALSNSSVDFDVNRIPLNDCVPVRSWSTGKDKESRKYRFSQGFYVGLARKGKSTSFKASFENLMTLAFMSLYHYDDGELYPTGLFDEIGIINTDWTMFDKEQIPNNYNRMLSFIGLAPLTITTQNEVERLYDIFYKTRNKWAYKGK